MTDLTVDPVRHPSSIARATGSQLASSPSIPCASTRRFIVFLETRGSAAVAHPPRAAFGRADRPHSRSKTGSTSRGDRLAPRDRLARTRSTHAAPLTLDSDRDNRATGAFVVIDAERTAMAAAGMVNAARGVVRRRPTV